jgi:hypothetical protein
MPVLGWAAIFNAIHDPWSFLGLLVLVGTFFLYRYLPSHPGGGTFGEHACCPLQIRSVIMSNPKTEPTDNTKKDPDEWVSGDDPMTGAQASYLKTLCEQAGTPELYDDDLTKAEASKRIDEMRH